MDITDVSKKQLVLSADEGVSLLTTGYTSTRDIEIVIPDEQYAIMVQLLEDTENTGDEPAADDPVTEPSTNTDDTDEK